MRLDDNLKRQLEWNVATEFLLEYNHATARLFKAARHGTPPEPDVLCRDTRTGERISIEIGTAYYDDSHAKSVWHSARGKKASPYWISRPDPQENRRVLRNADKIICRKSRSRYSSTGRLLLVVALEPIRLYLTEILLKDLKILRVPEIHPFDEIYVFSTHGEPLQLYPERQWIGTWAGRQH
jgi:hypothetical protein